MPTHWSEIRSADETGLDVEQLKRVVGLCARSPLRHPILALTALLLGIGVGFACAAAAPKVFVSEVSVVVQRASPMYDLAGAEPPDRGPENEPIRGLAEQVLRRENLAALARSAHVEEWITRPKKGLSGLKQRLIESVLSSPTSPEKMDDVVVRLLEKSLSTHSTPTTFTISAAWWDPEVAYNLATLALKSFLDDRHAAEVSILSDGIAALEEHAKIERQAVDEALQTFDSARSSFDQGAKTTPAGERVAIARASDALKLADPELVRALEDRRRQIRDLEDDRTRRLAELRAQQAGLLATYTPAHPAVQAVQSKIDAAAAEPDVERRLRAEERQLLERVVASADHAGVGRALGAVTAREDATKSPDAFAAPEASMALAALQSRLQKYEDAMDRISAAHLRLDLAEKAFKYRYSVFKPAELPTKPQRSKRFAMIATGVILGFVMSIFLSVARDLLAGRILESWQVEPKLGLRLLGEAREPLKGPNQP